MNQKTSRFCFCVAFMSITLGCQNNTDQPDVLVTKPKPINIPIACKQSAQVQDIWKLEPILVKNGEITTTMSKEEKEKRIHAYIARKNKQYQICLKGSK